MNDKREPLTDVYFRTFKSGIPAGQVIAMFPGLAGSHDPSTCTSYLLLGQHGNASISGVSRCTRPATHAEYLVLYRELCGIGYRLRIVNRGTPAHFTQRLAEIRR